MKSLEHNTKLNLTSCLHLGTTNIQRYNTTNIIFLTFSIEDIVIPTLRNNKYLYINYFTTSI